MRHRCDPSEQSESGTSAAAIELAAALPSDANSFRGLSDQGRQDVQTDEGEKYATHAAEPRFAPRPVDRGSSSRGCRTGPARCHVQQRIRSRRTRFPCRSYCPNPLDLGLRLSGALPLRSAANRPEVASPVKIPRSATCVTEGICQPARRSPARAHGVAHSVTSVERSTLRCEPRHAALVTSSAGAIRRRPAKTLIGSSRRWPPPFEVRGLFADRRSGNGVDTYEVPPAFRVPPAPRSAGGRGWKSAEAGSGPGDKSLCEGPAWRPGLPRTFGPF
jgi:hypothetical protein